MTRRENSACSVGSAGSEHAPIMGTRTRDADNLDGIAYFGLRKGTRVRDLGLWGLTGIIFFSVSGGPFGIEDAVGHAGPFVSILGFMIFAFIWAAPEALVTAEMSSAFPHNAGASVWVAAAFGPRQGFMNAWLSLAVTLVDSGIYPGLMVQYVHQLFGSTTSTPIFDAFILYGFTLSLGLLNLLGISTVGDFLSKSMIIVLLPFILMALLSIPHLKPSNWFLGQAADHPVEWIGFLQVVFWNLNYWDCISTVVGEISNPRRTLPISLFLTVVLVSATYVVPLMTAVGVADAATFPTWKSGQFTHTAEAVGGRFLAFFLTIGIIFGNLGNMQSAMVGASHHIEGLSDIGWLPTSLTTRTKNANAPIAGILLCTFFMLVCVSLPFLQVVSFVNTLYAISMLQEFAAFLKLRRSHPGLKRPFIVPMCDVNNHVYAMALVAPAAITCLVVILAPIFYLQWDTFKIISIVTIVGFLVDIVLTKLRDRGTIKFSRSPPEALPPQAFLSHTQGVGLAPTRASSDYLVVSNFDTYVV